MKGKRTVCVMLASVLLGCSHRDPIDRVVAIASNESVPSYLLKPIDLPGTATADQLVSAIASPGELHTPAVVKVRQVQMLEQKNTQERFTAVLLNTAEGQKVILLQPMPRTDRFGGWYFKVYDAK